MNDVMTAMADESIVGRNWVRTLAPYTEPDPKRSVMEIAVTVVPLALLWAAAWVSLYMSVWLSLALTVPAAGLMVRLFLIQHDCGHGAFFRSRAANDWVGRVLGIFTMTPYDIWRRSHAVHHATSGNLDRRGIGDLDTLTIAEYRALSTLGRLRYRLYRNPIIMFVIGPAYLFLLRQRLPFGNMGLGWASWVSCMGTNLGIALFAGLMIWLVGLPAFLLVQLPIIVMAASIGVWLFYIQHQFEETYWEANPEWSHQEAALFGSTHYDLPQPIRWMTANIGVHHVHHLMSRIPFYRLGQVLRDHPELRAIRRVTLLEGFAAARLKLWDEEHRRLVTFREARI